MKSVSVRFLLSVLTLAVGTLGCSPAAPPGEIREPSPAPPTPEPVDITPTLLAPATPAAEAPLSQSGPWLIFSTGEGLVAVNADGTGRALIGSYVLEAPPIQWALAAPTGGHIAFLTAVESYRELHLNIVAIPSGDLVVRLPLTTEETGVDEQDFGSEEGWARVEAARAIADILSFDWAPDGTTLAFMGMLEGPSSDLYTYSMETGEIMRLTSGPSQAYAPHYSPDGTYIVHTGARSFGTGAGYSLEGMWAARADGSGVITLAEGGSGDEVVLGWLDGRTFLMHSWGPGCGRQDLRLVQIDTQEVRTLWEGPFDHAVFDPVSKIALLSFGPDSQWCNPEGMPGTYTVPLDGTDASRIHPSPAQNLTYRATNGFFQALLDGEPEVVYPDGTHTSLDIPPTAFGEPVLDPARRWAAWPGTTLWIGPFDPGDASAGLQVHPDLVASVYWTSSGEGVYFFTQEALYWAAAPEFTPSHLMDAPDHDLYFKAWVQP